MTPEQVTALIVALSPVALQLVKLLVVRRPRHRARKYGRCLVEAVTASAVNAHFSAPHPPYIPPSPKMGRAHAVR